MELPWPDDVVGEDRHRYLLVVRIPTAEHHRATLVVRAGRGSSKFAVDELRQGALGLKAVLRRSDLLREEQRDEEPIEADELRIDFSKRTVEIRGEPVRLTYVEFEILSILARNPGRVFSRTMILDRLWGDSSYRDPRTIDVHIRHLREKIERDPKDPEFLFTVRGVGYHFRDR